MWCLDSLLGGCGRCWICKEICFIYIITCWSSLSTNTVSTQLLLSLSLCPHSLIWQMLCIALESVYCHLLIMAYRRLQHIKLSGFTLLEIKSDFFSPMTWSNPRSHLLYMLFLSSSSPIVIVLCCRWNVLFIIQSPTSTQRAQQTRLSSATAASGWDSHPSENNQPVDISAMKSHWERQSGSKWLHQCFFSK